MDDDQQPGLRPAFNEQEPLLSNGEGRQDDDTSENDVPRRITYRLYVSHFLSTWNSRVFEFGAVIYLATIYPGTLLPMSIYALARGLSAILFATAVGQYIDTGNRLQVVRVSIIFQRLVVATSCVVFYIMALHEELDGQAKMGMLVLLSLLACIEKLCSIMNSISVEKDWVVVVAGENQGALSSLNAQMRRIDLLCKLLGPLFIALIDGFSTKVAIIVNFAMNIASITIEYYAIARVYYEVPALQEPKHQIEDYESHLSELSNRERPNIRASVLAILKRSKADFGLYFRHQAFLPSFACALLYLTVLSFSGQMVTYLLSTGYTSSQIGITRTISVAFEVLATWVAPWLISHIGPVRAGLWHSTMQVTMLITGLIIFWTFDASNPIISASGLVGGTILSRLGLRGFDLCTQIIVQEEVEAENRGAFSSVEAAWQSVFELAAYGSTIVFFQPSQFKWPSLISITAVTAASLLYTVYVYIKRGHLIHFEKIAGLCMSKEDRNRNVERGLQRILSDREI
ncbi:Ferroporti-1 [Annulohypoxylon maeteangense]|uniref:Ferroporti-1 n=1 Tax=Annulohypoxylon maeteangense TaxID=1927788 RepID=UPI00200735F8|nr:Ferroporti-1 [Annulohypoxylon maeteangense]KAI0885987.1 Ferroporti-1 [Annulohypoxylon maeteangense]